MTKKNNLQQVKTNWKMLKGGTLGNVLSISGFILWPTFLLVMLIQAPGIISELWATHHSDDLYFLVIYLFFFGFGVAMSVKGNRLKGQIRRFKRYSAAIGHRTTMPLAELARMIDKPVAYVTRDLSKMLEQNLFVDAYLDRQNNQLIFGHNNYRELLREPVQPPKESAPQRASTGHQAVDQLIDEGTQYLQQIGQMGQRIQQTRMTTLIAQLSEVSRKIFAFVADHPQKLADIRQFMGYYLPTTLKLLAAYEKFEAQNIQGEHLSEAMQNIEAMLITIVAAFEKLLDNLFQDETLDIAADMTVLESMLAQEGLTGQDFKL